MNRKQGIVILCAGLVLNLLKMARPAWQENGESAHFLGVFDTSTLMLAMGAVAAVSAVLMLVFQAKMHGNTIGPRSP